MLKGMRGLWGLLLVVPALSACPLQQEVRPDPPEAAAAESPGHHFIVEPAIVRPKKKLPRGEFDECKRLDLCCAAVGRLLAGDEEDCRGIANSGRESNDPGICEDGAKVYCQ